MGTIITLSEERILELAAGWAAVSEQQDALNGQVSSLETAHDEQTSALNELHNFTLPELQSNLAENAVAVSNLNDTVLPDLNASLNDAALAIQNLNEVTIPGMQIGIDGATSRPQVFFQPEPPEVANGRDLDVNDVWYDTDDGNKQYIWNGVEWSTFNVEIHDFSITVRKLMSSTHMIY